MSSPVQLAEDDLAGFHRGDRAVLERCYLEHFDTVSRAVGSVLGGVDRESAIHDFFARLIADEGMRGRSRAARWAAGSG